MLSRLQAINQILVACGEQVILVEVAGAGDYANASTILDAETTKVLAKGFDFNTERDVALTPAVDGTITLPSDVLFVDPVDPHEDYVQRGETLFDMGTKTAVFTAPVKVNMVRGFPFEICPYHVQRDIVARAAAAYQRAFVGSTQLDTFAQSERAEAHADSQDGESDSDDYNLLDNPDLAYLRRNSFRFGGF